MLMIETIYIQEVLIPYILLISMFMIFKVFHQSFTTCLIQILIDMKYIWMEVLIEMGTFIKIT